MLPLINGHYLVLPKAPLPLEPVVQGKCYDCGVPVFLTVEASRLLLFRLQSEKTAWVCERSWKWALIRSPQVADGEPDGFGDRYYRFDQ